jgi:hypothetical protein
MTFLEAALEILQAEGRPMTARQLATAAIERSLVVSRGVTPERTLSAQLYARVRDHPEGALRRIAEAGEGRARRGSVRWQWLPTRRA